MIINIIITLFLKKRLRIVMYQPTVDSNDTKYICTIVQMFTEGKRSWTNNRFTNDIKIKEQQNSLEQ